MAVSAKYFRFFDSYPILSMLVNLVTIIQFLDSLCRFGFDFAIAALHLGSRVRPTGRRLQNDVELLWVEEDDCKIG